VTTTDLLAHRKGDVVAIAVADLEPGSSSVRYLDESPGGTVEAECVTLFAAAGAGLHLFTTGQGNIIGNPIVPVLELTANPHTAATMSERIDIDVCGVITGETTLDQAADATTEAVLDAASGTWARAEILGHREFVLTRLHRTA